MLGRQSSRKFLVSFFFEKTEEFAHYRLKLSALMISPGQGLACAPRHLGPEKALKGPFLGARKRALPRALAWQRGLKKVAPKRATFLPLLAKKWGLGISCPEIPSVNSLS